MYFLLHHRNVSFNFRSKNKIHEKYKQTKNSFSIIEEESISKQDITTRSDLEENLIDKSENENLIPTEIDINEDEIEEELRSEKLSAHADDPEIKRKKIKFIKLKMDYKLLK